MHNKRVLCLLCIYNLKAYAKYLPQRGVKLERLCPKTFESSYFRLNSY